MWLQSMRRTATSMPAPAAGAANGLSVLGRASRPQPRPPMHWKRPCAQIWSIDDDLQSRGEQAQRARYARHDMLSMSIT